MRQYFLRRLLLLPLTLLGITFIAFVITRFVPGGPLDQALAEKQQAAAKSRGISAGSNSSLSPQEELLLKRFYKLDRPLLAGYVEWLGVCPAPVQQQIVEVSFGKGEFPGESWNEKHVTLTFSTPVKNATGRRRAENLRVPAVVRLAIVGCVDNGHWSVGCEGVLKPISIETDAAGTAAAVAAFTAKHKLSAGEAETLRKAASTGWKVKFLETPNRPTSSTNSTNPSTPPSEHTLQLDIYQTRFDGLFQGNLGVSFLRGEPVLDVILSKLPVSIWFGIWSLVLTYAVCIPLGIVKALRHRAPIDNATSVVLFTGYALPGYILAVIFLYLFAFHWKIFPHSGFGDPELLRDPNVSTWALLKDRVWHTFLPLVCLTSGSFALMTMLMKNTLLDNLALDYVRTAVAKGVTFRDAVLKHALRNSLVPIATGFGNCLAALLMGSFLIEKIFDIDGIGLLSFTSLVGRDYPVFLGLLSCTSLLLLLGNILSDLCVAIADPRIRFGE